MKKASDKRIVLNIYNLNPERRTQIPSNVLSNAYYMHKVDAKLHWFSRFYGLKSHRASLEEISRSNSP